MKPLFRATVLLIIILLVSGPIGCAPDEDCKGRGPEPGPPLGQPDDSDRYVNGDYISISYWYWCHQGKAKNFTYTSADKCTPWESSYYESTGICP